MEWLAHVTCSRGGLGVDIVARGLVVAAYNGAVAGRVGRHRVAGKGDGGGGVDRGSHHRGGNNRGGNDRGSSDGMVVNWIRMDRHDGAGCWVCERGGTGLVRPGVVGEALGGNEVLTGGEMVAVHVAPARPRAVNCLAVALQVQRNYLVTYCHRVLNCIIGENDFGTKAFFSTPKVTKV